MPGPKKKKGKRKGKPSTAKRALQLRDEGQEYAKVNKLLGDRRMECLCFDGEIRLAQVRGNMRKWCRIDVDDIVLVSLRDFQDKKVDIIHKYFPEEIRELKKMNEIPDIASSHAYTEEQDTFVFESEAREEEINIDAI